MKQPRARASRRVLALAAGLVLLTAARDAGALSFSLGPGDVIVDLDFSGMAASLSYDGTSETLTVTADVGLFRLQGGSQIVLAPGQVVLQTSVMLDTANATITDFFGSGSVTGTLSNGLAADFTLIDVFDTPGPTLLMAGDFDPPGLGLSLTGFFGLLNGSLQGDYHLLPSSDPGFVSHLPGSVGNLTVQLAQLQSGGSTLSSLCQVIDGVCFAGFSGPITGLQSFTAQPTIDLTPVPEPASAAAVGLGLAALAVLGRRWTRPS